MDNDDLFYVSSEEEIQEAYENMTDEELYSAVENMFDNFEKMENGELSPKDIQPLQSDNNKIQNTQSNTQNLIKKRLENVKTSVCNFIENSSRHGIVNVAIWTIIYSVSGSLNELFEKTKKINELYEKLDNVSENIVNKYKEFPTYENNLLSELDKEKDKNKWLEKYEKVNREFRIENINLNEKEFLDLKQVIHRIAKEMSNGNEEKEIEIYNNLEKEQMIKIQNSFIDNGLDVFLENENINVNDNEIKVKSGSFSIVESESIYNKRIKDLEDKGLLAEETTKEVEEISIEKFK